MPTLKEPTKYCCLINPYADSEVVVSLLLDRTKSTDKQQQLEQVPFISIPCLQYATSPNEHHLDFYEMDDQLDENEENLNANADAGKAMRIRQEKKPFPPPQRDFSRAQLKSYYLLDAASVLLSEVLSIKPGMRVLDMCAAPGGKSLSLAYHLFPRQSSSSEQDQAGRNDIISGGKLVCNEISIDRRKRLQSVLKDYLPSGIYNAVDPRDSEAAVQVTGHDGCRYSHSNPHFVDYFDRVLLDAPCSSERHLIHTHSSSSNPNNNGNSVNEMDWSVNKSRNMSHRQLQLLMEAVECLKPNGMIAYATCSLSPLENDQVIQRCLEKINAKKVTSGSGGYGYTMSCAGRKWKHVFEASGEKRFPIGEPTGLGWIILPDNGGYGPLYFSLLMKKPK